MPVKPFIGLIIATYLEAKPFVLEESCEKLTDYPFPSYRYKELLLVVSGMGKAGAAAACTWLCMEFSPACVVNLGAAGAVSGGYPVGSLFQIKETIETDRLHVRTRTPFRLRPCLLEGFEPAVLATRETAVVEPEDRRKTGELAELADMEGAAVLQAARRFDIPCYIFKFVSDTPEHTNEDCIPGLIRKHRKAVHDFFMEEVLARLLEKHALGHGDSSADKRLP